MQLTIHLPPEIEPALRRRAEAAGQDMETFISRVVKDEIADDESTNFSPALSPDEFMARLRAMIARHGTRVGHFDDSRESIYAGRGE